MSGHATLREPAWTDRALTRGRTAGGYTIEAVLTEDTAAVSYLARDSEDRRVILRECFPDDRAGRAADGAVHGTTEANTAALEREQARFRARAAALLDLHRAAPSLCPVIGCFDDLGTCFLVEACDMGKPLAALLADAPDGLPPLRVHALLVHLLSVAEALAAEGLAHGDIQADHITVRESGSFALTGFGRPDADPAADIAAIGALGLRAIGGGGGPAQESGGGRYPLSILAAIDEALGGGADARSLREALDRRRSPAAEDPAPRPIKPNVAWDETDEFGAVETVRMSPGTGASLARGEMETVRNHYDPAKLVQAEPSEEPAAAPPDPPREEPVPEQVPGWIPGPAGQLPPASPASARPEPERKRSPLVIPALAVLLLCGLGVLGYRMVRGPDAPVAEAADPPRPVEPQSRPAAVEPAATAEAPPAREAAASPPAIVQEPAPETDRAQTPEPAREAEPKPVAAPVPVQPVLEEPPRPDPWPSPVSLALALDNGRRDCPRPCPAMVIIPPGRFDMGIPPEETARENMAGQDAKATPVRRGVVVRHAFYMSETPVTRAEYAACVKDGMCRDPGTQFPQQADTEPVVNIALHDAETYAAWLIRKSGGKPYRLPSEAEWEYAARAGKVWARYWGDSMDELHPHTVPRTKGRPMPAGKFPPNGFGLYDMLGLVWQWTEDCWHPSYEGAPLDSSVWGAGGDCHYNVLRGGSWSSRQAEVRAGLRAPATPATRGDAFGLRVARSQE